MTQIRLELGIKSLRPFFNDKMEEELAKVVGEEIYEWGNGTDNTELQQCIEDAKEVLSGNIDGNGYELAKDFESDFGYDPDAEMVEILDSVWYKKNEILNNTIKQWVIDDNIKPEYSVGDTVMFTHGREGEVIGEITSIYENTAQYVVCVEILGHEKGKSGSIVNYEKVRKM
jgi:hypothetical protein